jgi:methionine-S-sulfoxide reductase
VRTRVGYAGGTSARPTYHDLGDHSESIQVDYDPQVVTYDALLDVFWTAHDPTAAEWSRQYRSAIFVASDEEKRAAVASRDRRAAALGEEIATAIEPLGTFTLAEDYHQKYSLRRHDDVVASLLALYPDDPLLVESTAAARLNAYFDGSLPGASLAREMKSLGLATTGERGIHGVVRLSVPAR